MSTLSRCARLFLSAPDSPTDKRGAEYLLSGLGRRDHERQTARVVNRLTLRRNNLPSAVRRPLLLLLPILCSLKPYLEETGEIQRCLRKESLESCESIPCKKRTVPTNDSRMDRERGSCWHVLLLLLQCSSGGFAGIRGTLVRDETTPGLYKYIVQCAEGLRKSDDGSFSAPANQKVLAATIEAAAAHRRTNSYSVGRRPEGRRLSRGPPNLSDHLYQQRSLLRARSRSNTFLSLSTHTLSLALSVSLSLFLSLWQKEAECSTSCRTRAQRRGRAEL